MSERLASLIILLGGGLVILALWVLSILAVRWDTNRRRSTKFERRAWLAFAVLLPLLGFAVYLAVRLLHGYLAPPAANRDAQEEARLTAVKGHAQHAKDHPPVKIGSDVPEPAWGKAQPGRTNGAQAQNQERLPATAAGVLQRQLSAGYALVVLRGPHMGQQFFLNRLPLQIGRGPDVSISLDADLNVSRKHAEIYEWNGRLRIRDLKSSHGTWINDQSAADQVIVPGDRIGVGSTELILREIE